MNYNGEISKEIHVALTAISRAATAAYEAGDKGLWLDILGSNQALFKIYIAQLDALFGKSTKDTCPECEGTNLNESKTRCFNCEPSV